MPGVSDVIRAVKVYATDVLNALSAIHIVQNVENVMKIPKYAFIVGSV